ncbi:hypothetical protein GCM10025858_32590 [Alicyclobacillus sacchari]|uniref:AMP-binding protein n=1 Tax=Alicyclobacillus sacchari TaxID=392010 RepID=UPI0023E909A8|nr:AMP-binding protein [Alicyclobacillus sacchari]GMA58756.1 hypothetical protein GCM10025858_32590 [Alicyclobacillus sacchari]
MSPKEQLDTLLHESRTFSPSESFRQQANVQDARIYESAEQDPEGFWSAQAHELTWFEEFESVCNWDPPHAQWFIGGKLNAAYNCVDRHTLTHRKNKAAIIWEGEPGDNRVLTYDMLRREVDKAAHALRQLGVQKGDRVTIYLPMVPELPISMLACAKIGAIHSVVFGGFSAQALRDRIIDADSKLLITADAGWRRGKIVPLKANADEAVVGTPIEKVIVVERVGAQAAIELQDGRDVRWQDLMASAPTSPFPAEPMDSEDYLFLLYTSGTTGKPKGIAHSTAAT